MDPWTVSTGIAGFFALALEITKILKQYVDEVNSASADAHTLLVETTALCECLEKFIKFLRGDAISNLPSSSALRLIIAICDEKVRKLHTKLTKFHNSRKLAQRLMWPFDKGEYTETIAFLRHCTQTFGFSITASS